MKDVPHHMKKFMQKFATEKAELEETEDKEAEQKLLSEKSVEKSKIQKRKLKKLKQKKQKLSRTPTPDTIEIQNKKMKNRVPIRKKRSVPTYVKKI